MKTAVIEEICRHCADECLACADHCQEKEGMERVEMALRNCAQECRNIALLTEQHKEVTKDLFMSCAHTCERCSEECSKHDDVLLINCAKTCTSCADDLIAFVS